MNRLKRGLLSTAVVLSAGAGLALYAFIDGYVGGRQRQLKSDEEQRMFRFGRIDVRRGQLRKAGLVLDFEWTEREGWRLVAPVSTGADQDAVTTLVDQMVGLRMASLVELDATPDDLAQYGLEPAQIGLTLWLLDGQRYELSIGAKNELDAHYYVTDQDKKRIGRAHAAFYWAFDRDLFAFRSKRIFDLHRDQVFGLTVERGGTPLYALSRRDGQWLVTQDDRSLTADPLVVDRFLLGLTRDLKAEAIATDSLEAAPEARRRFFLDPPAYRVRLFDAKGVVREALIGVPPAEGAPTGAAAPAEEPKGPYVFLVGGTSVAQVHASIPQDLDRDLGYFRDRSVAQFDPSEVKRIQLTLLNGENVVIERAVGTGAEASWRLARPKPAPARAAKIQKLLLILSSLRSDQVQTETATTATLKEWHLDPPEQRVVIYGTGLKPLADIRIGRAIDREHVYITAEGLAGRVDTIRESQLGFLPKSPAEIIEVQTP